MMSDTTQSTPVRREQAQQVFRQFAWHLAGTIAKTTTPAKSKPTRRRASRKPRAGK